MLAVEPTKPIMLYRAWYDVLGKYPDYPAQQIGDCTSFGTAHALDCLQCVEKVLTPKDQSSYFETDTEALYGAGREVAGMLHSWGDGCYGAAMAKALLTIGAVSRELLGTNGTYSGNRAKQWGRSGIPDNVRQMAGNYKVGAVAKITDRQSAISALWNGLPIAICSNQGFSMQRDQDGYCRAQGHWSHCMHVSAFDPAKNRYLIGQSWGSDTPSGPTYLDQPTFSFWADADIVERNIFGADDSWALAGAPDFAKKLMPPEWTTVS